MSQDKSNREDIEDGTQQGRGLKKCVYVILQLAMALLIARYHYVNTIV